MYTQHVCNFGTVNMSAFKQICIVCEDVSQGSMKATKRRKAVGTTTVSN
jgi:hypothetical protein